MFTSASRWKSRPGLLTSDHRVTNSLKWSCCRSCWGSTRRAYVPLLPEGIESWLQAVLYFFSPFWTSFLAGMDPRGRHNCGPHQFHGKTPIQIVQKFKDRQPVNLAVHVVLWLVPGSSNIPLVRDWVHDNPCFLVTNDHMIYIDLLWQFIIRLTVSLFSCLDSCLTLPCLTGKVQSAGAPAAAPLWGCSRTNGLVFGRNSEARNLGKATEPMTQFSKVLPVTPITL